MKILIHIHTDSELIAYEAMALSFVMASFDHEVQLYLGGQSQVVLCDPKSRMHGMIKSLELYDIPKAWHNWDNQDLPQDILPHLTKAPTPLGLFDGILHF